jgi:hypothetical protein
MYHTSTLALALNAIRPFRRVSRRTFVVRSVRCLVMVTTASKALRDANVAPKISAGTKLCICKISGSDQEIQEERNETIQSDIKGTNSSIESFLKGVH